MGQRHRIGEIADQFDRSVGIDDLEKPAFPQVFATVEMRSQGLQPGRRQPDRIIVCLVDDVVGGLGEGLLRVVGNDQTPKPLASAGGPGIETGVGRRPDHRL